METESPLGSSSPDPRCSAWEGLLRRIQAAVPPSEGAGEAHSNPWDTERTSGLEPGPSLLLHADPSPPFPGPCGPEPCLTKALLPCHPALRKSDQLPDGSGATAASPPGFTHDSTPFSCLPRGLLSTCPLPDHEVSRGRTRNTQTRQVFRAALVS